MSQSQKMQTYLTNTEGQSYMVSTAYRQSSAPIPDAPWYWETLTWEWNPETKERGDIVDQSDGHLGLLPEHAEMVTRAFNGDFSTGGES